MLDIRVPIGGMFALLGVLLAVYGLATAGNAALYRASLGINVNLWWGLAMTAFGAAMLFFGRRALAPQLTMHFRLLIDPPQSGDWNMALDEALLEAAAADGQCWWRFYRWSEPTLSLGYFQDYAQRDSHAPSRGCPAVRRLTGGGAILHDRELTYSFAVPIGHRLAAARDGLYQVVHRSLLDTLADWSISAALASDSGSKSEAFLCFQRRAAGDVLCGDVKIAGSAQRRRRGAVLQHGSVLLQRSAAAPELPGLAEAAGLAISAEQLIDAWLPKLAQALGMPGDPAAISEGHRAAASDLAQTRYASRQWTECRQTSEPEKS